MQRVALGSAAAGGMHPRLASARRQICHLPPHSNRSRCPPTKMSASIVKTQNTSMSERELVNTANMEERTMYIWYEETVESVKQWLNGEEVKKRIQSIE